jgi:hypothetical protein
MRQGGAQNLAILRFQRHQRKKGVIDNNREEDNSTFAAGHKALRIGGKFACRYLIVKLQHLHGEIKSM